MMTVTLDDEESLLLSALLCVGTIASNTPECFDGIQLNERMQKSPETGKKYAEACLLIIDHQKKVDSLISKLHGALS